MLDIDQYVTSQSSFHLHMHILSEWVGVLT